MRRARVVIVIVATIVAVSAVAALLQAGPCLAYLRLRDTAWIDRASPNEARSTAHAALGFWLGDPHDAFLVLERVGDQSSIPHLRTAMAGAPEGEDAASCTWVHGRDALEKISARAAGESSRRSTE